MSFSFSIHLKIIRYEDICKQENQFDKPFLSLNGKQRRLDYNNKKQKKKNMESNKVMIKRAQHSGYI
jgi:hypothetical protein